MIYTSCYFNCEIILNCAFRLLVFSLKIDWIIAPVHPCLKLIPHIHTSFLNPDFGLGEFTYLLVGCCQWMLPEWDHTCLHTSVVSVEDWPPAFLVSTGRTNVPVDALLENPLGDQKVDWQICTYQDLSRSLKCQPSCIQRRKKLVLMFSPQALCCWQNSHRVTVCLPLFRISQSAIWVPTFFFFFFT